MIPVKNVYYMLSYAFDLISDRGYKKLECEDFQNTADLFAAILITGTNKLVKRGLNKDYLLYKEPLSNLKGKINISDSIKNLTFINEKLVCEYDDFSVNSLKNRILKTTIYSLLKNNVSTKHKKELARILQYFKDVDIIDLHTVNWNIQYNRNDYVYRTLIAICYLTFRGLIQKNDNGKILITDFINENQLYHLYEKFILEFYKKEHKELSVHSSQIEWQLDDQCADMLPIMQSDIMLEKDDKVLIIDAKYYYSTVQTRFNKTTVHSGNLYQIFTYVKNEQIQKGNNYTVSGMLLYAKTDEKIVPNVDYKMSGNQISVKTLDLNLDFPLIKKQLDDFANNYFI